VVALAQVEDRFSPTRVVEVTVSLIFPLPSPVPCKMPRYRCSQERCHSIDLVIRYEASPRCPGGDHVMENLVCLGESKRGIGNGLLIVASETSWTAPSPRC